MGRAITVLLTIALVLVLVASCQGSDPFGATTREQIRSDTAITISDIEARAAIEQTALEAQATETSARVWAETVPMVALIFVAGVLIGMVVYFQGKAYLIRLSVRHSPPLTDSTYELSVLRSYAARTNQAIEQHGDSYLLVDQETGRQVRVRPKRRHIGGA